VTPEKLARRVQRHEERRILEVEDRITGMLVRKGVPIDRHEEVKVALARRIQKLVDVREQSRVKHPLLWQDVHLTIGIVLHDLGLA
jgi:hypothetical protein